MLFPYIYAANDSGTGTGAWYVDAQWQNIDWISYFTSAKYRKWEVGENEDLLFDGNVKIIREHGVNYSDPDGTIGYKTDNSTQVGDTIIKGPKYYQYPRYTYTLPGWNPLAIQYRADFRLKIDSPSATTVPVCSLFVTTSYYDDSHHWREDILASRLLTSDDLDTDYGDYLLDYNYSNYFSANQYPQEQTPIFKPYSMEEPDGLSFNIGAKVQFKIQWLGNKQLFVDRIEVYDGGPNGIWNKYFKQHPNWLADSIVTYNNSFAALGNKLKYYYTMDEPHSIDSYEPLRVVQHILDSLNINADLLTHFFPEWNGKRDDDPTFPQYVALAQPKKLFFWYAPFGMDNTVNPPVPVSRDFSLYHLRANLESASLQQPGFFFSAQTFGAYDYANQEWVNWMLPTPSEVKVETMLSLAHGCQGIYYEEYYSYCLECETASLGLVDFAENGYSKKRDIWYTVQSLSSRLKGKLGKTLMSLNYDSDDLTDQGYLRLYPYLTDNRLEEVLTNEAVSSRYLHLSVVTGEYIPTPVNFHAGFFKKESDNNYFLLTNVITSMERSAGITVFPPAECTGYNNYRFRNVEPQYNFDTTFTESLSINQEFPAGEGYLYEVAPVVKYGGKLEYDETVANNTILHDDMSIENGVTLTINGNYTCYGNIYLKGNAKIQSSSSADGNITFASGKTIIVMGQGSLIGTQTHPLTITAMVDTNIVTVNRLGGLTTSYCNFVDGRNGIKVYGGAGSININHCSFDGQSNSGVLLLGSLTASPKIKYSSFNGIGTGIWAIGNNDLIVLHNTFTENAYDVKLNLVTNAQIVSNTMSNSSYTGLGVLFTSSSGYIRQNQISGHQNGIYLANSSPNIGGNNITDNAKHGIYVGTGSVPDLRGYLVQHPCNNPPLYYPLRGYNTIYENGLANQIGVDNDGSEIYLSYSNILMNTQCNDISDDRDPSPNYSVQNLMGGYRINEGTLNIENQGWGYNPNYSLSRRFGTLNVDFDPYFDSCPLIETPINCGYIVYANDRTAIDTLYPVAEENDQKDNLEMQLMAADSYYNDGNLSAAEPLYTELINNYPSEQRAVKAYTQLYSLKKVTDSTGTNFSGLKSLLQSKLLEIADSAVKLVASQLSILCNVGNSEYIPAINTFDEIAEQNSGTEEGLYAEIDAFTTAVISYNQGGGLQKGLPGKYKVNSEDDLLNKLNKIMNDKFESENKGKQIIPTEYSLYNNYPNPFNPTTTIRFDIPERTNVELVVYDILGRKVKSLVSNEMRNPGRYEVSFNASALASGVYIYKLTTKNYSQARKMLLVK